MAADHDNPPSLAVDFWGRAAQMLPELPANEARRLVLGLLHLRRLWEAFDRRRKWVAATTHDVRSVHFTVSEADRARMLERPELYRSAKICWLPRAARWPTLRAYSGQPNLGRLIDAGILALEEENAQAAAAIPRLYGNARVKAPALVSLMALIDHLASSVADPAASLEELIHRSPDFPQSPLGTSKQARLNTLRSLTSQAPNGKLLDRLDDQLRELDRLIDATRKGRASGGSGD